MNLLNFSSFHSVTNLQHAITTRAGGVSLAEYSSLNLAFHVGDDPGTVVKNREVLAGQLGFDSHNLVCAQQVHGSYAECVGVDLRGRGATNWENSIPQTDALICADPGTPVMVLVADCAPVLIVDPTREILAVIHAGWRGALGKIASKTLAKMQDEFGTPAHEILCGIGPCLCVECLEIGEEVAAQVESAHALRHNQWQKPHLDLRAMIRDDLTSAGVLLPHIETMDRCPRCENETFFSHRGQNGKTGRFGLLAQWRAKM